MRLKTTAHEDGDLSVRLTGAHIDALKSAFSWMSVRQQAEKQEKGEFVASFDETKLLDLLNALERDGRQATPEERGIDWRNGKEIDLS